MGLKFAFGTDDDKNLSDEHFGNAKQYFLYRFFDGKEKFIKKRENPKFNEDESLIHGDPAKAAKVGAVLKGSDVLVAKRFGPNIVRMKKKFVCVIVRTDTLRVAMEIIKSNLGVIELEKNKGEQRKHLVLKNE